MDGMFFLQRDIHSHTLLCFIPISGWKEKVVFYLLMAFVGDLSSSEHSTPKVFSTHSELITCFHSRWLLKIHTQDVTGQLGTGYQKWNIGVINE